MLCHVADNLGVLDALGAEQAVVVGHDWGAPTAWNSALLRPDRFRAVAGLSVPYSPRGATAPLPALRALAGDNEFYMEYFQEPGRAEAEFEGDVREWLRGIYLSASGDGPLMDTSQNSFAIDPPRRPHAGSLRGRAGHHAGLAQRRRPRGLRRRVRAQRARRAASTATATCNATGRTSPSSPACRSRCRRCSSAAARTGRRCGASGRSTGSPQTLPGLTRSVDPRRLRPLDPAGTAQGGERAARGLPRRARPDVVAGRVARRPDRGAGRAGRTARPGPAAGRLARGGVGSPLRRVDRGGGGGRAGGHGPGGPHPHHLGRLRRAGPGRRCGPRIGQPDQRRRAGGVRRPPAMAGQPLHRAGGSGTGAGPAAGRRRGPPRP